MSRKIMDISPGLAEPYDSTATYAVGRYVLWQNAYWRCTSAIASPENWNPSHWTRDEQPLDYPFDDAGKIKDELLPPMGMDDGAASALRRIFTGSYASVNDVGSRLDAVIGVLRKMAPAPKDTPLYVQSLGGTSVVSMGTSGSPPSVSLEYSVNSAGDWKPFTVGATSVELGTGDFVCFRAGASGNERLSSGASSDFTRFTTTGTGRLAVGGNAMSLLYHDMDAAASATSFPANKSYTLAHLFRGCATLQKAGDLVLPATTLTSGCYYRMFGGCSSLVEPPALPALNTVSSCYSYMFYECSSLTRAPDLPGTETHTNSYNYMFSKCSSLAYVSTALTGFGSGTTNWLDRVAAAGEFHCNDDLVIGDRTASTVPEGWTITRDR